MALRQLEADLKTALSQNVPFTYAHLIKFERPAKVSQYLGVGATDAKNYTYITDAPFDVVYNDGTGNGPQVYRANKLQKLGTTNETIKAKASNITIVLDSSTIDSQAVSPTVSGGNTSEGSDGSFLSTATDFVSLGFREGDKVTLKSGTSAYNDISVRINTFTNEGLGFRYTALDTIPNISSVTLTSIDLASEELTSLTASKDSTAYSNYINREVHIHKVFIASEPLDIGSGYNAGDIIGGAGTNTDPKGGVLLFRGIISNASLVESPTKSLITWTASSHWADFNRVQGRRTEDTSHRAVNSDGIPDREAAVRQVYADDLGFAHATTAVNLTAVYNRQETKIEIKEDKTLGVVTGVEAVEVPYDVPTEVDLKFNLQAKYLPVIYGVQKVDTIPIFVDTRNHDSTEVHMCTAVGEGKITGLYDLLLNGSSSICTDESDFEVRGTVVAAGDADGKIDFLCRGYQNRGDTLKGYNARVGNPLLTSSNVGEGDFSISTSGSGTVPQADTYQETSTSILNTAVGDTGLLHGLTHSFDSPIDAHLTFHNGSPYQKADDTLVAIGQTTATTSGGVTKNFKIQTDYYTGKEDYFGPNHRMLDTAYLHSKFQISEGETELPKFKVIAKGVSVECFNYDNSYAKDIRAGLVSADASNFEVGHTVSLKSTATTNDLVNGATYTIIDKWFFYDAEGDKQYRFRFRDSSGNVYAVAENITFYMERGSHKWYMATYDSTIISNGSIPGALTSTISSYGAGSITLNSPDSTIDNGLGLPGAIVKLVSNKNSSFISGNFSGFSYSSNQLTNLGTQTWTSDITTVILANGVRLPSSASATADKYNGLTLEFTRTLADGTTFVQKRKILDYHGGQKVAIVDAPWDSAYIPGYDLNGGTDTVTLYAGIDERPSVNPAMQLIDYLRSERYGKGLKITDIDLPTFIASAKLCDAQSDVTVVYKNSDVATSPTVGATYSYGTAGASSGYFHGKVSRVTSYSTHTEVTFTEVMGKLAKKWNKFTVWLANELIWNPVNGELKQAQAGQQSSFTGTTVNNTTNRLTLTKQSGTGSNLPLDVLTYKAGNNNPVVKSYNSNFNTFNGSGYSLYDADDLKYWKYIGWDDNTQRHATRHQMNTAINTGQPLFSNVNKMLEQFNGMLRYSLGKYQLNIKAGKGTIDTTFEKISQGDLIGEIKITDNGSKKTYNSANLSFPDPQNRFENREIAFYNSSYLKEDKGIPKNLSYQARGITNYFNARFNIEQKINESRYGTTINFKLGPKGLALLPGEIVQITYPRFGWVDKDFRITTLNFTSDCLVSVTANEHDDSAYEVKAIQENRNALFEPGGVAIKPIPDSPSNLSTSAASAGGIALTWTNSASFSPTTHTTQIWKSSTQSRSITQAITANSVDNSNTAYTDVTVSSSTGITQGQLVRYRNSPKNIFVQAVNGTTITLNQDVEILSGTELVFFVATLAAEVKEQTEYIDPVISSSSSVTRYYWLRYAISEQTAGTGAVRTTDKFSPFHPTSATGGVAGTSQPSAAPRSVRLTAGGSGVTGTVITYDVDGDNPSPSSISIAAVTENTAGTVQYDWFIASPGGSFSDLAGSASSNTFTPDSTFSAFGGGKIIKVVITDTVGTTDYTAEATIQIVGQKVYADGIAGSDGRSAAFNYAAEYATFETQPAVTGAGGATDSYTTSPVLAGTYALQLVATADSNSDDSYAYFSTGSTHYNLTIPANQHWVLSASFRLKNENSPDTTNNVQAYLYHNVAGSNNLNYRSGGHVDVPNDGAWHRKEWALDLSSNSSTQAMIRFDNDAHSGNGDVTLYIDQVQLEIKDSTNTAKPWIAPNLNSYTIDSTIGSFNFQGSTTGTVSSTSDFSETFLFRKGDITYTYDGSSAPRNPNSFRYGTKTINDAISNGNPDLVLTGGDSSTEAIGINVSSSFCGAQTSVLSTFFDVQLIDNNTNQVVQTRRISLSKTIPGAGGAPGADGLSSAQLVDRFMRSRSAAAGDITYSSSNNAVKLVDAGGTDSSIAMVLPARSVSAGQRWNVSFAYKADVASNNGLYARINSDTSVLSSGNTAVASGGAHETGVTDVSNSATVPGFLNGSILSNVAVSTDWVVKTFVYVVPTNAVVASLQFLRWTDMGAATNALYIKDVEFSLEGAAGAAGARGSSVFNIEESTAGTYTTSTDVVYFTASTFDAQTGASYVTAAQNVARDIIALAPDNTIRPNDKITVTDNSLNRAVTRVYDGGVQTAYGSVSPSDFSTPVVETFDGSVIVDGTLSADKIQADSVAGNDFKIASTLTIGNSSAAGTIKSFGKDSATDTTQGFFLGVASNGSTTFAIGGGGNGSTVMNNDGIKVIDDAGVARVKLGDLSSL